MATTNRPNQTDASGNGQAAAKEVKRRAASGASSAHDTVEHVADRAHDAVDKMASAAGSAADTLGERSEQFSEYADQAATTARSYMQTHPLATLGMAVAAGFLISKLLSSNEPR